MLSHYPSPQQQQQQQQQKQQNSSSYNNFDSGSFVARAVSPGTHLRVSPQPVLNSNDNSFRSQSSYFSSERNRPNSFNQPARDFQPRRSDYSAQYMRSDQTNRSKVELVNQINNMLNTNRIFQQQQQQPTTNSYTSTSNPKLRNFSPNLAEVLLPKDRLMRYQDQRWVIE